MKSKQKPGKAAPPSRRPNRKASLKCPKCRQTDSFKVDMWEVTTYSAWLSGEDITDTKHDDCIHVAIDALGGTLCCECGHEGSTSDFLTPNKPFPIQQRPDFGGEGHDANNAQAG